MAPTVLPSVDRRAQLSISASPACKHADISLFHAHCFRTAWPIVLHILFLKLSVTSLILWELLLFRVMLLHVLRGHQNTSSLDLIHHYSILIYHVIVVQQDNTDDVIITMKSRSITMNSRDQAILKRIANGAIWIRLLLLVLLLVVVVVNSLHLLTYLLIYLLTVIM